MYLKIFRHEHFPLVISVFICFLYLWATTEPRKHARIDHQEDHLSLNGNFANATYNTHQVQNYGPAFENENQREEVEVDVESQDDQVSFQQEKDGYAIGIKHAEE